MPSLWGSVHFRLGPCPTPRVFQFTIWFCLVKTCRSDSTAQQRWTEAKVGLHMLTPEGSYPKGVHWYDGSKGIQSVLGCVRRSGSRLLIEGGGGLLSEFLSHSIIHELFVTLCPSLVGGQNTPSSCDGTTLNPPVDYQLLSVDRVDNELYLHYGHRSIAVD